MPNLHNATQDWFLSDHTVLGDHANAPPRHLYVYVEGNPIAGWDPDGQTKLTLRPNRVASLP